MSSTKDSSSSLCSEFSGLLLPFVDGELGEPDTHAVLNHISGCQDCTQVVQEQQRVRALLAQVSSPPPSPNLLKRVQLALDEVDREVASEAAPAPAAPGASWRERLFAMFRGGLVMAPAAAAAGLLWVSLRPDPSAAPSNEAVITRHADATPAPSANAKAGNLNANALPASVPPTILGPRGIPQDIEFVSAKPDLVRYRNPRQNFELIDRRLTGVIPRPSNAKLYREGGITYMLSRDAQGYAHLDFELGPHTHRVMLVPDQALANPGAISVQDPHFSEMLRYARALQRTVQP